MKKKIKKHAKAVKGGTSSVAGQNKELGVLRQIIETVSYNLDLGEVLERIVEIVSGATMADSCFLYLINDRDLVLRASKNPHSKDIGNIKLKVGEGITGWVAENKKVVAISGKAYEDERFSFFNSLPEDRYEAFLSAPIVYRERLLGVINVQHKKAKNYRQSEIDLMEAIGKATGGAIENARLFTETEILKEALESRKLIEKAKGILMKDMTISEDEAYKLLHKKSMDKRLTMKEVSQAVILSSELKA